MAEENQVDNQQDGGQEFTSKKTPLQIRQEAQTRRTEREEGGQEQKAEITYRVHWLDAANLYFLALIFDIASIILGIFGINIIVTVVAFVIMTFLYIFVYKINPFGQKNLVRTVSTWVAEAVPWLGAIFPGYLLQTFLILKQTKKEDEAGTGATSVAGALKGAVKSKMQKSPASGTTDGVRPPPLPKAPPPLPSRQTPPPLPNRQIPPPLPK